MYLQLISNSGNILLGDENVGVTDGHTRIINVRKIEFNNDLGINTEIKRFINAHANDAVENALIITPAGNVYTLRGNEMFVNPDILNRSELLGSIVIHNYPPAWPDSFSSQDFVSFFEHGFNRQDLITGGMHHSMKYIGNQTITGDAAYELYAQAFLEVQQHAMKTQTIIPEFEQLAIMRQLSKTMKGLIFNENPRH